MHGSGRWSINGEETEEVKVLKHLWVWFDQGMLGNVQMEKMKEMDRQLEKMK